MNTVANSVGDWLTESTSGTYCNADHCRSTAFGGRQEKFQKTEWAVSKLFLTLAFLRLTETCFFETVKSSCGNWFGVLALTPTPSRGAWSYLAVVTTNCVSESSETATFPADLLILFAARAMMRMMLNPQV